MADDNNPMWTLVETPNNIRLQVAAMMMAQLLQNEDRFDNNHKNEDMKLDPNGLFIFDSDNKRYLRSSEIEGKQRFSEATTSAQRMARCALRFADALIEQEMLSQK